MTYFSTSFLLLAGILFWGAGAALLITPARYRRLALIFAAPAGLALQSFTVWIGAHAGFAGTNVYGRASLVLPVVLLGVALWRRRKKPSKKQPVFFSALLVLMAIQLAVMVLPFALGGHDLTTCSIGSLDAADYGAGARVFQEFAHADRSGFLGQTEVVSIGAVDNFFDFWLRTNHFTPSALIALNGSFLGLGPHQLTGLITVLLLVATTPMVFWLARAGLGYRPVPSFWVAAIYAFSPINWYAVYQVSPAQIVAANAIALLTWCGLVLWRQRAHLPKAWCWAGLLFVGYGLVFGGYNFIIVATLVPLGAVVVGCALVDKDWRRVGRWLVAMGGMLLVSGLIYYERLAGVIERLVLFGRGYGWGIATLTPEGWLGFVHGPWLTGYSTVLRVPLAIAVVLLVIFSWWKIGTRRLDRAWVLISLCVPILVGYAWFQWKVAKEGEPASYQAYKLFAVFYPGMLAAFCCWGNLGWLKGGLARGVAVAGMAAVLVVNVAGEWRMFYRLQDPPLSVDNATIALGKIETMQEIGSVNMRLEEGWVRLWANAFLLRKKQFFEVSSYEGRGATALKGEWDLLGDFFSYAVPGHDSLYPAPGYTLLRRSSASYVEARLGEGWIGGLRDDPRPAVRSRWVTEATAKIVLTNPHAEPLKVSLSARLRAVTPRDCVIRVAGVEVAKMGLLAEPQIWSKVDLVLPPGKTAVEFSSERGADYLGGRSKQPVYLAVDGFDLRVVGSSNMLPAQ
ncbi:MAG: hypothetical protein QM790_08710 [Nibricoccus sp.]